jgi:uncharacterized protein YndB with AHSA1/START domain
MSNAARAIADLDQGIILASVEIAVPPERVFAAITDGTEIVRWWGTDEPYRTTSWTSDLRPGGKWRAEGAGADGTPFWVEGEFLEVDPPHRLVQTWNPQWDQGTPTTITYTLSSTETGTRLTLRHEGFGERGVSCQGHSEGWIRVLGWLARHLVTPPPDASRFYLARLLPPRPDFARTLSSDERTMMGEHADYWRTHMAAGKVLALGPVDDPKGGWGLGVMRVTSEAELLDLQSHDPAITAGRGLSYENLPMFNAVWPVGQ